jgi:hypothetical protein
MNPTTAKSHRTKGSLFSNIPWAPDVSDPRLATPQVSPTTRQRGPTQRVAQTSTHGRGGTTGFSMESIPPTAVLRENPWASRDAKGAAMNLTSSTTEGAMNTQSNEIRMQGEAWKMA